MVACNSTNITTSTTQTEKKVNIPIKDDYLENLAHNLADAINSEDAELYQHFMAHSEQYRSQLVRSQIIEFRDRVHYLADSTKSNYDDKKTV